MVRKTKKFNKNIDSYNDEQVHFVKNNLKEFLQFFGYSNEPKVFDGNISLSSTNS